MSSIFGVFRRDGGAPAPEMLAGMIAANDYWSPDGRGSWANGPIAVGHCLLRNVPESRFESQPVVARRGGALQVAVSDARLDNRSEIASALGMDEPTLARTSDGDLISMAWSRWGPESPGRLLGDFAYAVWDTALRRLYCVRDQVGIRPLYYFSRDDLFVFAGDIRVLLAIESVPRDLSWKALAHYLQEANFRSRNRTLIEAVSKVPAATVLTVSERSLEERVYWRLDDTAERSFASVEECAEELSGLLTRAVTARLRSDFPLHAHLSGGLDSSSIAVAAARELGSSGRHLHAFTWSPPASTLGPPPRESVAPKLVAGAESIALTHVALDSGEIVRDLRETDIALGSNQGFWYENLVLSAVQRRGGRAILCGLGGDELISSPGAAVHADLLWHGRPAAALKDMLAEAGRGNRSWRRFARLCLKTIAFPALPRSLHRQLGGVADTVEPLWECLQPRFADFVREHPTEPFRPPIKSHRGDQLYRFGYGHIQSRVEAWVGMAWKYRVEYSYPLLDRRVLELAVSVPPDFYRRRGISRLLFREAVRGWLPSEVRLGVLKREPQRVLELLRLEVEAIEQRIEELSSGGTARGGGAGADLVSIEGLRRTAGLLHGRSLAADWSTIRAVEGLLVVLRIFGLGVGS